jgi:hypothetical protein
MSRKASSFINTSVNIGNRPSILCLLACYVLVWFKEVRDWLANYNLSITMKEYRSVILKFNLYLTLS